ncbi:hypothetical protein D3C76_1009270 [compost metagenome]
MAAAARAHEPEGAAVADRLADRTIAQLPLGEEIHGAVDDVRAKLYPEPSWP